MEEKLTPQQLQAVKHRGGRLLVSAAAGSGKTKVLVDRLLSYLTDPVDPANIDDFLMITYTKAAASELRGKIASRLSREIARDPGDRHLQQQLQRLYLTKISTVHAFCGDILREYAYRLDISGDFRVADENECRELRTQVVESLLENAYDTAHENPDFCAFVDTQGLGRDDRQVADLVLSVYDSARCHLNPRSWLDRCLELVENPGDGDAADTVYGSFLMERLRSYLQLQIAALERCIALAEDAEGFDKPVALLISTVRQLQHLAESTTWDQVAERKDVDFGRLTFPKNCNDLELKENIKALRDSIKAGLAKRVKAFGTSGRQVLGELASVTPAVRGLICLVQQFGKDYAQVKKGRQVLDFGDLEHKMLDLLLGKSRSLPTAAAAEVGSRFREVMVDEYQDSNEVQDAIYGALTARRRNLFLVGDVKQSIYQFRLADPGIFIKKYEEFKLAGEAVPGEDCKVLLSQNFRSGGGVLAAANAVFRLCMCQQVGGLDYGPQEALYEGVSHVPLGEPEAELYCINVQQRTYPEEAAFVAGRILELLDGSHYIRDGEKLRPIRPEDIAILLRSPGSMGGYYQKALEQAGLRCATGGGTDLLQAQEIAALRSILQAIHNPMQDIPLLAAMANPVFGFTADDLANIRSKDRNCAFYEVLCRDSGEKARKFLDQLLQLREVLRMGSLTGLLEELFITTNLEGIYGAMEDGTLRTANLQTFFQLAAEFEVNGSRDLGRFLEYLDAMEAKGLISAGEQTKPDCVTIMSIHKSKGLEFPVVFLCGLARSFNMESQRAKVLCHKELGLGLSAADTGKRICYPTIAKRALAAKIGMDAISEELRVLYVAMTRARDRLIMTYASDSLQKDLASMVSCLSLGGKDSLVQEAACAGAWVLLTALHRTEAGELFALGGRPPRTEYQEPAWHIRVVEAPTMETAVTQQLQHSAMPADAARRLQENLAFRYPYQAATVTPSKQTATQRKGREKDQEIFEHAPALKKPERKWRKPAFLEVQSRGKDRGIALHAAMQYIRYEACIDIASVRQEIARLVQANFITQAQGAMVDAEKIANFFATPLGRRLRSGRNVQREFKFSILEDAAAQDPTLAGEQVLLQGVVDCLLLEEDGITVLDFKTDYVTADTIAQVTARYSGQVETYARAVQRIFQKPVKQKLLYFFSMEALAELA